MNPATYINLLMPGFLPQAFADPSLGSATSPWCSAQAPLPQGSLPSPGLVTLVLQALLAGASPAQHSRGKDRSLVWPRATVSSVPRGHTQLPAHIESSVWAPGWPLRGAGETCLCDRVPTLRLGRAGAPAVGHVGGGPVFSGAQFPCETSDWLLVNLSTSEGWIIIRAVCSMNMNFPQPYRQVD